MGGYLKCVLKYMEEPLCQFPKYPMFRLVCQDLPYSKAPHDGLVNSLASILADYDEVHYLTWRFVIEYLFVIGQCNAKLTIRNVSTIFSDILFRPLEVKSADMQVWRHFTDILVLMITEH